MQSHSLCRTRVPSYSAQSNQLIKDKIKLNVNPFGNDKKKDRLRSGDPHFDDRNCLDFQLERFVCLHLITSSVIDVKKRQQKTLEMSTKKCHEMDSVCAIDPGVRKFLTMCSPEGKVEVLGSNTTKELNRCMRRIEKSIYMGHEPRNSGNRRRSSAHRTQIALKQT